MALQVLVVEDDPLILLSAAETLRLAGLAVIEAETAEAAAALLLARADDIDAVFTDIETPGALNGLELARLVSEHWPSLPVVMTSGRISPCLGDLPNRTCFVGKPYDIDEVVELIVTLSKDRGDPPDAVHGKAEPNVAAPTVDRKSVL